MQRPTQYSGRDPVASPEVAKMARIAFDLLSNPVTESTHHILVAHGMPREVHATLGTVLEMALARELPILDAATDLQRHLCSEWGARLELLYRMHASSSDTILGLAGSQPLQAFELMEHAAPVKLPLSRSDFDLLAESAANALLIGRCARHDSGSVIGHAFAAEIDRCQEHFHKLSDLASKASQKIAA